MGPLFAIIVLLALNQRHLGQASAATPPGLPDVPAAYQQQQYYYYNEVTGEVQWEDPGDVPYEDSTGRRYWLTAAGEAIYYNQELAKYTWVEQYSDDMKRSYFYNQETRLTTWERPADLAWRRVRIQRDEL